ncbi:MAG: diaminopimelate decarboxylase [Candidatus Gastranaerophilaceae bacterium]|jgi:diaminopimelate decarboxylase
MEKTNNQNIWPCTAKINDNGNLEIAGCDTVELVEKYGTPLYVYDEETIRETCKQYTNAFSKYEKINMFFASKAFMTKSICCILASEGFGLDLVSGGEIYTALKAGFDMSKTLFNGNNKTIEELELAVDAGVGRISVDNFLELALLDNLAKSKNIEIDILLRITPGIECHTHEYIQTGHLDSKFGFDLTQIDEAIERLKEEYLNLNLKGLHAHIGSQIFETKVYYDEVAVVIEQFALIKDKHNINLEEVNLGGGLGITYTTEDNPPSIDEIADTIIRSIDENTQKFNISKPLIYIEPGRSIVGTAGVTLYTVGSSKQVPDGKKYIAVDGGMADNPRPSMYQAKYTAIVSNKADFKPEEKVTIAGRFCESGDIIINDIDLPTTDPGDIICVFNTGAYGYSMSSNYNRVLKSAAVLVNQGQSDIIIRRETYDELIANDEIPQRLNLQGVRGL